MSKAYWLRVYNAQNTLVFERFWNELTDLEKNVLKKSIDHLKDDLNAHRYQILEYDVVADETIQDFIERMEEEKKK